MNDSSSFTSLFALVDSHLAKLDLKDANSAGTSGESSRAIEIPSAKTTSDSRLLTHDKKFNIPQLSISDSSIKEVLTQQITNMLIAKEERLKQKKLEEELKQRDEYIIDLESALCSPVEKPDHVNRVVRKSSPVEPLIFEDSVMETCEEKFKDKDEEETEDLPCLPDLSYLLGKKHLMAKCSAFGKVLTARLRPKAQPYLHTYVNSTIKRFDFKTKSPYDLVNEKLHKPTYECSEELKMLEQLRLEDPDYVKRF